MTVPVLVGLRPDGTPDPAVAEQVASTWLSGGLVGLPTETVYGLAADAQDAAAVARIYAAKGRPADHPVIVHVAGAAAMDGWAQARDPRAQALAAAFWPGPLTLVIRRRGDRAGDYLTGGQDTVALRCPAHPVAHACLVALARLAGDPARGVAAPSANRFGRVSPTRARDVVAELGERLDPDRDLVVDGGASAVGVESTIVDCTAPHPQVLRLGAISQAQVDEVLRRAQLLGPAPGPPAGVPAADASRAAPSAPVSDPGGGPAVRAPGTLESHYAPAARVVLVEHDEFVRDRSGSAGHEGAQPGWITGWVPGPAGSGTPDAAPGLIAPAVVATPDGWARLATPATAAEYARVLYAALRRADELGLATVVAVLPDPHDGPLAQAVRDRLARAAHGG